MQLASPSKLRFFDQVRKDEKIVLIMSREGLHDYLGSNINSAAQRLGLDGGGTPGTLTEGPTSNQIGWADYTRNAYSTQT